MKALILAAGFGTRLKPLTDYTPKPLCQYFGIPLFDLAYYRILQAGIKEFACNSHYLSKAIKEHLKSSPVLNGHKIFESYEPIIRGTGGCLYPLKDWLGPHHDLLIYNGDILSDIDLRAAINFHRTYRCDATMLLLAKSHADKTPVFIDKSQNIVSFGGNQQPDLSSHTFTGIHILSAEFVRQIPGDIPWSIIDSYRARIRDSFTIKAFVLPESVCWHDMGSPLAYWQAHEELLNHYDHSRLSRLGLSSCHDLYGYSLEYLTSQKSVISQKLKFSLNKKSLYKSIVLADDCLVPEHVQLDQCIVLPDVKSINHSTSRSIISAYTELPF